MSGREAFIDTNIALYFLKGDTEVVEILRDKAIVISFITEIELLSFPKLSPQDEKLMRTFISLCKVAGYDNDIRDGAINFRKTSGLKLPDAIIASTSVALELPLLTADKQFKKLEKLSVIYYQV